MYPCGSQRHAAHRRGFEGVEAGVFRWLVTREETFGHFVHMMDVDCAFRGEDGSLPARYPSDQQVY